MQSCPKPCAIAFITTVTAAFLLIFQYSQAFPAEGAAASPKAVSGVDDLMKNDYCLCSR